MTKQQKRIEEELKAILRKTSMVYSCDSSDYICEVVLGYKNKSYKGFAQTHELDYKFHNNFFGISLAEMRACKKILLDIKKETNLLYKELKHLLTVFFNSTSVPYSNAFFIISKRFHYYSDKLFVLDKMIIELDETIKRNIASKEELNKRLVKNKNI